LSSEDPWKDDKSFENVSNREGLILHRLSWHCASLECEACDGRVRYHVKRFKYNEFNAKTGETVPKFEEFEWDTDFQSVQLTGGIIQSRENTPEGSRCECFCHRKMEGGPRKSIPFVRREGKTVHELLSPEERKSLK
jgi:hypothetical protein